jgi:hypothetical protein
MDKIACDKKLIVNLCFLHSVPKQNRNLEAVNKWLTASLSALRGKK